MATKRAPFTQRLAAMSAAHPYRVIGLWMVFCVLMGLLAATQLQGKLTSTFELSGSYQSVHAKERLRDAGLPPVTDSRETVLVDAGDHANVDDPIFIEREQAIATALRHKLGELLTQTGSEPVTVQPITLDNLETGKIPTPSVIDRQSIQTLIADEKAAREAEFTRRGEGLAARGAELQAQQETLQTTQQSLQSQGQQGVITPVQLQASLAELTAQGEALATQAAQLETDRATLNADIAAATEKGKDDQANADAFLDQASRRHG